MALLCARCGYENKDNYRFCGMCGGVFPINPAPDLKARPASSGVSTSFPGPQASARSLAYLLEDDEPHATHGRMYLALVLLLVSGLLLAWHWRRDGYPWSPTSTGQVQYSAPASGPDSQSPPAQSSATPVSSSSPETAVAGSPESSQASTVVKTDDAQHQLPASKGPAETAPNPESAAPQLQSDDSASTASASAGEVASAELEQAKETEKAKIKQPSTKTPAVAAQSKPSPAAAAIVPAIDLSGKSPSVSANSVSRESTNSDSTSSVTVNPEDKLVADGEKYLYGNGVPQDCDRATRNLKVAASRSNPRAQSLLGSMYASGNCVSRDLPTAYHWFAQALHQDPSNTRIERDLELIWKQLTPGERQIALHNSQ